MRSSPQPAAHSPQPTVQNWLSAVSCRLTAVGCRLSALFGMPDYARYLEHQRAHHPEWAVMSEKEFVRLELERKYAGGGGRCC